MSSNSQQSTNSEEGKLEHTWGFWTVSKDDSSKLAKPNWAGHMTKVATLTTVKDFWQAISHIEITPNFTGHIYLLQDAHNLTPNWDEPAFQKGIRVRFQLSRNFGLHFWQSFLMATVGEMFDVGNEICNVGIKSYPAGINFDVWIRHADNDDAVNKVEAFLRTMMGLPDHFRARRDVFANVKNNYKKDASGRNYHNTSRRGRPKGRPIRPHGFDQSRSEMYHNTNTRQPASINSTNAMGSNEATEANMQRYPPRSIARPRFGNNHNASSDKLSWRG